MGHSFKDISVDSPKAILSVARFLVNIGRLPLPRFNFVALLPEVDEKVRDLARRWQEPLQVDCVVARHTEASR